MKKGVDPKARAARVAGLGSFEIPTLEAVARRRLQLWTLTLCLLLAVATAFAVLGFWRGLQPPTWLQPPLLQTSLLAIVALFSIYAIEKELNLRRLSELLVEERVLSAALAGRLKEVEALLESSKAMNAVLELDEVLDTILRSALELLDGRDGSIMLTQGEDTLRTVCARGASSARGATVPFGRGIAGRVAERREGVVVNGVLDPSRWEGPGLPPAPLSALSVPLVHRDSLLGVMNINANASRTFTEHDLRALTVFAEQAAGAIANARLYEEQTLLASQNLYHALHDPLTTLPNRALFIDRVDHALARRRRGSGRIAVLYIDLDDFKEVNDSFGHDVGDRVLVSFGDRLRRSVRSADTVARLGGDEFAVLLEDVGRGTEVAATAERILASLAEPFIVEDERVFLQACIGIADELTGGGTALDLLRSADSAMNAGKRAGKARITTFDESLHPVSTRRPDLERELEDAVEAGQLSVAYQPIFDLTSSTVVALEALTRWNSPARGTLLAGAFLPHAERAGLLPSIDRWVLRKAAEAVSALSGDTDLDAHLALHVNVSATLLEEEGIAEEIARTLAEVGLSPSRLVVELGETNLVRPSERLLAALAGLREQGMRLALDRFGAGYASLAHLRNVPVDFVKLDRVFIDGLSGDRGALGLVTTVLRLAEALKIDVIAEGIERQSQVEVLVNLGCRLGQGWLLADPIGRDALAAFLLRVQRHA